MFLLRSNTRKMTNVTYMDMQNVGQSELDGIYASLSDYRRRRADAYKFDADRRLSLGVGYLLDRELKARGMSERDAVQRFGAHGKPYIADCGFCYSLAHSGTIAVCAVSDVEVGVDIERIRPLTDAFKAYVTTDAERQMLSRADIDPTLGFFRLWTAKESYFKCLGVGLTDGVRSADIELGADIIAYRNGRPEPYAFAELPLDGYALTVCCGLDRRFESAVSFKEIIY